MKYLVSFYNIYHCMGKEASLKFRLGTKESLEFLKRLSLRDSEFKNIKEITEEEFYKEGDYSFGNCKEFDIFAEAIEFYTAVCCMFPSVVLATTEGCIICEYHLESKK